MLLGNSQGKHKMVGKVLSVVLIVSLPLTLSGCAAIQDFIGQPPSPEDRVATPKTLEPGGQAVGNGVHVLAPARSLDSPISVSMSETSDPTSATPLPQEASPLGDFYRISAGKNLDIQASEPALYIALPVPNGADASNLAVAVRVPREELLGDSLPVSTTHVWSVLPGAYDPNREMLITPLRFLSTAGHIFVLVESADYDSPSMSPSGRVEQQGLFKDAINFFTKGLKKREDFFVKCRGFNGGCGSSEKRAVRGYLNKVYDDFVPEFHKPDLRRTLPGRKVDGKQGRYYLYIIRKDGTGKACSDGSDGGGMYISPSNTGITCYQPGSASPSEPTTRMEFFHAIQYNYAPVSWTKGPKHNPRQQNWIMEGTAQFVESTESDASNAHRLESENLRKIDTPLTKQSGKPPYPAYTVQDFWVHLINQRNATPELILEDIFGKQNSANPGLGPTKVDMLYGLDDAHWDWVRNQAFESRVTAGNPKLNDQCVFDPRAVNGSVKTINYNAASRNSPLQKSVTINKLTATVVKVELQNGSSAQPALATVNVNTPDSKTYAKVYREYSGATTDCFNRSSPMQLEQAIPSGSTETVYVLMSNSDYAGGQDTLVLRVNYQDIGVEITQPSAGAMFKEGSMVSFNANVKLPSDWNYNVSWSTDGRYSGAGSTIPGGSTGLLCRGKHTITARVEVTNKNFSLSDQVTIQVKNRQPSLSITSKPKAQTIPRGSQLKLRAKAQDRTCESPEGNAAFEKIGWLVNGQVVASGPGPSHTLFHKVRASVESQIDVQAQYTDKAGATATSKTLTFHVIAPPQGPQPPSAAITNPPDIDPIQGSIITLKADATDPDGGSITSYTWKVTGGKGGEGKTKTFHGNNKQVNGLWNKHGFSPGEFFIELTVTDDDGQKTTTSVRRRIIPSG